jgi:hypothetical protein
MGQQSMKLIEIETDDVHLRLLTMIWVGGIVWETYPYYADDGGFDP